MSFTSEEKRKWLEEKRNREADTAHQFSGAEPLYTCLHCNNQFSASEGAVTKDAGICDVCNY